MLSDEDMEGGFEDVEEENEDGADSGGDEVEASDEEPDGGDVPAQVPPTVRAHAAPYATPSNEEIQGLKETGELYMNNVFKLQLDEMLKQSQPRYSRAAPLELALRRLQTIFDALPSMEPRPLGVALRTLEERYGRPVYVPFAEPVPRKDAPFRFSFERPSRLSLVGSWPLHFAVRRPGDMDVDVEATMPSSMFQEKDTFNGRYFQKRAFYLCVLAEAIRAAANDPQAPPKRRLSVHVQYMDMSGDRRRTCIVLRARGDQSDTDFSRTHAVIRIHLAHEPEVFPVGRLAPTRNSLRGAALGEEAEEEAKAVPTPRYNAALLSDALRTAHLVFLHEQARTCGAFAEATQLLKIWATQRGYGSVLQAGTRRLVAGTESARFVLTMVLAHLLQGAEPDGRAPAYAYRPKLRAGFSSYQLFRGVLEFLAHHDFERDPVFMRSQPRFGLASRSDKIPKDEFRAQFTRVLVEPSGSVNLFTDWPAASVDQLQHDAAQSMQMLNDAEGDHFAALFLQPCSPPATRFDEVAAASLSTAAATGGAEARIAHLDAPRTWAIERLLRVATMALGARARHVAVCYGENALPFDVPEAHGAAPAPGRRVELGVQLDAEHAWRQVDHGPPPEQAEAAAAFRAFWGEMAELRRFRDGRVLESVVWPVATLAQRAALPRRVLQHALAHHACITGRLRFVGDAFAGLTEVAPPLAARAYLEDPAVRGFQLVQAAFDSLAKQLRALDSLPLSVTGVTPTDAALRSMSVFAPGPLNLGALGVRVPDTARFLRVQEVLLTLESSGRWPDDLAAIQAMKTAFYERLAAALSARLPDAQLRVAFDSDAEQGDRLHDASRLEVVLPTGFAFALRIQHEREQTLLQRVLRDERAEAPRRRAAHALARYEATFVHAPRHHAALAALVHRYPGLAESVRLFKRWLGAQLLTPHVAPPAAELLCAAVFLSCERGAPCTGVAGFLAVLDLLRRWDWRETPLLVPLGAATAQAQRAAEAAAAAAAAEGGVPPPPAGAVAFPAADRATAEAAFRQTRASDPAVRHHAWFIATETDHASAAWCRDAPAAGVADGIRALATRALELLERSGASLRAAEVRTLFTPTLAQFDFVVRLRPQVHVRYAEALAPDSRHWLASRTGDAFRNLAGEAPMLPSVYGPEAHAGLDPVREYVELLQSIYGDTMRLFYDEHGGTVIGGLWNPSAAAAHPFKVLLGYSSVPLAGERSGRVTLNRAGILAEVERLGAGLVESIEAR